MKFYRIQDLFLILFVALMTVSSVQAEEISNTPAAQSVWKNEAVGQLNLTQNRFDNWSQGGENAISWQLGFRGKTQLKTGQVQWANSGKIAYGETQTGEQEFRKSSDEIKIESVFTYSLATYLNPYVSIKGETQLSPSYTYQDEEKTRIAAFLDPGYFIESLGLGYAVDPVVETRLGLAIKETVTRDFPVPYTDNPDTSDVEKMKIEAGLESTTDFRWQFSDIMLFTSKLELFSNLKSTDTIDVRWDNTITAAVAKYINVQLNVELFYDRDISVQRQLKQVLSLGLTYSFFN
jgi:Protein of unknown function (DUF3078)